MRIIFFGSSQFAVPSLRALKAAGYKIACVITQPDREKGRGLHLEGTAVKQAAQDYKLRIYQPLKINTDEVISFIRGLNPDLFVEEPLDADQLLADFNLNLPGDIRVIKIEEVDKHFSVINAPRIKERFRRSALICLHQLLADLGVDGTVVFSPGGIALCGDATLRASHPNRDVGLYVCIDGSINDIGYYRSTTFKDPYGCGMDHPNHPIRPEGGSSTAGWCRSPGI